jgi:predicted nucleotidyltransferase
VEDIERAELYIEKRLGDSVNTMSRDDVLIELHKKLADLPNYVKDVNLFGSVARGEVGERSDLDILVLYRDLGIGDPVERRHLYKIIADKLADVFNSITLIDMDLDSFLRPSVITPLLLNIYADGLVVIDKVGNISYFLDYVRRRIAEVGLKKVKNGKAYYWVLPKPLEKVEIL